ncbi:MAG: helicase-related protein [Hyphomonadaceae bacterium]
MYDDRARVRAVLGPTNTGKTHLAVERMLAHGTGMIGLPLRLLAREIYDRMVRIKGEQACALITGEERIRPHSARYFACTVEAMPVSEGADFIGVDEVQLAADPDRGHVFTSRILKARGRHETMLMGADTIRPILRSLDLDIDPERRERFSRLDYAGPIKITKLPKRSVVVAFSAEEVYAIAELLKRQRGGCAVIMGALSPRTRNAQVALYQSGEVDYVVATDAIGMGLNLDVSHVAFASRRKFDGRQRRALRADELAQIAGRAGRFRDDGTFGETADCEPLDEETVERITEHRFEPLDHLNWRNSDLDFSSVEGLIAALQRPSPHPALRRAPEALDEATLTQIAQIPDVRRLARSSAHVRRLWDLCTLPDFRKSGLDAHLRLVSSLVEELIEPDARLKDEWVYDHVERLDRIEGDIDTLQQRLADIRTWTYAANRADWIENAPTWRARARDIEDRLSDALHEGLMQRFVDRRTSALLRTLSAADDEPAEVAQDGAVAVGGHVVGHLDGLVFSPDTTARTLEGRALRNAALKSLRPVIERRLIAIASAGDHAFELRHETGEILHLGAPVARLVAASDWLRPNVELMGAPEAHEPQREAARGRIEAWVRAHSAAVLGPLMTLNDVIGGDALPGPARGIAYQLLETGAAVDRRERAQRDKGGAMALAKPAREALKAAGVHSGRIAAWIPALLKPAAGRLLLLLRAVHTGRVWREAPSAASFALKGADQAWSNEQLQTAGYLRLGPRAVRADMAERLAWSVSQARKASETSHFEAPADLAALVGCPGAEFPEVLRSIGLTPAERDKATGAVTRWRYRAAQRAKDAARPSKPAPPPSGPFAALAELVETKPVAATKHKRRRRSPRARREAQSGDGATRPDAHSAGARSSDDSRSDPPGDRPKEDSST